jgi:hypothetical protein
MIKIISEPHGTIYKSLIDYAGQQCSSFSLVWPVNMKIDDSVNQIHHELIGFIESENEIVSEWQSMDDVDVQIPKLRKFVVNSKSLEVLVKAPMLFASPERENKVSWRIDKNRKPGLYSWISPALPEDLTFYTSSGDKWMFSISHEEEAYFNASFVSPDEIIQKIPGLNIEIDKEDNR